MGLQLGGNLNIEGKSKKIREQSFQKVSPVQQKGKDKK